MDAKKPILDPDCLLDLEIKILVFKCQACLSHCEFGSRLIRAFAEAEREIYHRKMETE